jgi:heterodisulfide reductase subunit C
LKEDLDEILMMLRPCFQCGSCSGSCTIFLVNPQKNPRITVEKLLLGDLSVLDDDTIFYCTTCGSCYSRCPQQVDLTQLLISLKNWVIANNHTLPEYLRVEMDILFETGFTVKTGGVVTRRRKKLGLPEIEIEPDNITAVRKVMEKTGFKQLIEKYKNSEESLA